MSLLDDIAARKGYYAQHSYDPETADSVFVIEMNTRERGLLVAAVRGAQEHHRCNKEWQKALDQPGSRKGPLTCPVCEVLAPLLDG